MQRGFSFVPLFILSQQTKLFAPSNSSSVEPTAYECQYWKVSYVPFHSSGYKCIKSSSLETLSRPGLSGPLTRDAPKFLAECCWWCHSLLSEPMLAPHKKFEIYLLPQLLYSLAFYVAVCILLADFVCTHLSLSYDLRFGWLAAAMVAVKIESTAVW